MNRETVTTTTARARRSSWTVVLAVGYVATTLGCSASANNATGTTPATSKPAKQRTKAAAPLKNADWWPNRLDLRVLKHQAPKGDPVAANFDYAKEFLKLDLGAVKRDIAKVLARSQKWWPADYGNYAA